MLMDNMIFYSWDNTTFEALKYIKQKRGRNQNNTDVNHKL